MDYAERTRQLETKPVGRLLLELSIPAVTAAVINASHNVVNRVFVGQFLGKDAMAAITLSMPIMTVMLAAGMMISIGSGSLISIRLGEKKNDEAERLVGQALFLFIFMAVGFFIFGMLFQDHMLRLFRAEAGVIPYAKEYISLMVCGAFFHEMSFGVNGFLRAEGRARAAMVTTLISALLNIAFDILFLVYFRTGIWGAAAATILAQFFSTAWVMWQYCSGKTLLRWRWKYIRWDGDLARMVFLLGLPPFIMQCLNCILQVLQMSQLGKYGAIYGAAHGIEGGGTLAHNAIGIIIPVSMCVFFPLLGLNQGAQPIVGYNIGARHYDRVAQALKLTVVCSVIFAFLCTMCIVLFPELILRLFVDSSDASSGELIKVSIHAARIFMLMFPAAAVCVVAAGYFQANGMPRKAICLTLVRQFFVLIPMLLILPPLLERWPGYNGMDGVWWATPISDFVSFILATIFLVMEFRRLNREHAKNEEWKMENGE